MGGGLNPDWMGAFFRASRATKLAEKLQKDRHLCHKDNQNPPMIELMTGFSRLELLS
jgi:hypothetical protein